VDFYYKRIGCPWLSQGWAIRPAILIILSSRYSKRFKGLGTHYLQGIFNIPEYLSSNWGVDILVPYNSKLTTHQTWRVILLMVFNSKLYDPAIEYIIHT
jgi:hypothetical protein